MINKYKFFNKDFEYFLFFQEYFKSVRNILDKYNIKEIIKKGISFNGTAGNKIFKKN